MFGFGQKNKDTMKKVDLNSVDLSKSNDFQMLVPKYEYTVKIFEEDGDGKLITSIQKGVKANSDKDVHAMFALSDQRIQILEKRELESTGGQTESAPRQVQTILPQQVQQLVPQVNSIQPNKQVVSPPQSKPVELQVKYFSGGGIDFKMVGNDLYQKQWVRATEDDCKKIRIINDANNKLVELKGKHFELLTWVKVETTDQAVN